MLSDDVIYRMFPARAGMSLGNQLRNGDRGDVPRASGDEPSGELGK